MAEHTHVMTMLVDNQPRVLSRVVGLFSARGFSIDSLNSGPTFNPEISRITIVTKANGPVIEQIEKQLRKLVNVRKLRRLDSATWVQRELILICVKVKPNLKAKVQGIVERFNARIVDSGISHQIVEMAGPPEDIPALLGMLEAFEVKKLARTGPVGLRRESI